MQSLIERLEASGYARSGTVMDPGPIRRARRHPRPLSSGRRAGPSRLLRRHARIDQGLRARDATHQGAARTSAASAHERGDADARGPPRLPPALCRTVRTRHERGPALRVRFRPGASIRAWSIGCRCSTIGWRRCSIICRAPSSASILSSTMRAAKRLEQIADHYDARAQALERKAFGAPPYHPVPPESLFLERVRMAGPRSRAAR